MGRRNSKGELAKIERRCIIAIEATTRARGHAIKWVWWALRRAVRTGRYTEIKEVEPNEVARLLVRIRRLKYSKDNSLWFKYIDDELEAIPEEARLIGLIE